MFQTEIFEVLDAFGVECVDDFYRLPPGQKPYLIGRLYRAFKRSTKELFRQTPSIGGLKLRFETTGDLSRSNANVPNVTFLKKSAFYANQTLVTFPFREVKDKSQLRALREQPSSKWSGRRRRNRPIYFGNLSSGTRTPRGGFVGVQGRVYEIDPEALKDFLDLLVALRPAAEAGITQILPTYPDTAKRLRTQSLGFRSANFKLPELQKQFFELSDSPAGSSRRFSGVSDLLLPHFEGVPIERILEIRAQEDDLYSEFQRRLEKMLDGASETDSEKKILESMREVDEGIRVMHRRFKEIQQQFRRKNVYMLVKFLAVGAAAVTPLAAEAQEAISAILGGTTAFEYLDSKREHGDRVASLKDESFYLPWLVFRGVD